MDNMEIYESGKNVPIEAKKTIKGGRLNGFTDVNPMWRIRKLTELFGPCGIGWYYTIEREWLEASQSGEVAAFVRIHLFIKHDGEWSMPIVGVGGSAFIANEAKGPRMSDEAYKMAQTDALSVACKNLGIGASVYWEAGETKYSRMTEETPRQMPPTQDPTKATPEQVSAIQQSYGARVEQLMEKNGIKRLEDLSREKADEIMDYIKRRRTA